jgi:hypothetical protein
MGARDIILRRRAALVASALSGIAASSVTAPARATDPSTQQVDAVVDVDACERAARLREEGKLDEALEALFTVEQPGVDNLLLRGRILADLGRWPAARTALTLAQNRITDPDRKLVVNNDLADLATRTAQLDIQTYPDHGSEILLDGVLVGISPLPAPLFIDPGEHVIVVKQEGYPPASRTFDVAGGATLTLDMPLTEPHVCLSMLPPPGFDEARAGAHWGIGAAAQNMINLARDGGVPLMGGSIGTFVDLGLGHFGFQLGPIASVFGSERDVAAIGGARFEVRVAPLRMLALSLSTEVGYFYMSDNPEPAELEGLPGRRTVSSFYAKPDIGVSIMFGPIEAGPRIGVMMSRAEEGTKADFDVTYLSAALWISYVHVPDPFGYDDL